MQAHEKLADARHPDARGEHAEHGAVRAAVDEYQESVLPQGVPRVAIEAAHPMSWYEWVGSDGVVHRASTRFGASAPYEKIYEELGLTVDKIVAAATTLATATALAE